jgi:hypothetical protein
MEKPPKTEFVSETSEEEKQRVKKIEGLPLADFDKADLMLILQSLKQATDIRIYGSQVKKFMKSLQELGLAGILGKKEKVSNRRMVHEFYIGRTEELAKQLKSAWDTLDDQKIGSLSGYPPSAIEAYIKMEVSLGGSEEEVAQLLRELFIARHELPEDIRKEDYLTFESFRLSRTNFRDELETVKRWAEEIKRLDPSLYQRVVEWDRNN